MHQHPRNDAQRAATEFLRYLETPQSRLACALGEFLADGWLKSTSRRRPGRQKPLVLSQVISLAGNQFPVDKLRRRVFDQAFFFGELEIHIFIPRRLLAGCGIKIWISSSPKKKA